MQWIVFAKIVRYKPYSYIICLCISFATHIGLFFIFQKITIIPSVKISAQKPIKIHIISSAKKQRYGLSKPFDAKSKKQVKNQERKQKRAASVPSSSQTKTITSSYSNFLFKSVKILSQNLQQGEDEIRTPYIGKYLGEVVEQSQILSTQFDLPLVYRRELSTGKAVAKLKNHRDDFVEIETIYGNPEIRAALFETLVNEKSWKNLLELFHYFGSSRVKITIEYNTRYAPNKNFEFDTEYKIFNNEVVIKISRNLEVPKHGGEGIPIEDEHSRRAKRRDQEHLTRLRENPAFKYTISNYKLPKRK